MNERDKELWGMMWRFGLVLAIVGIITRIALAVMQAAHISPFIGFFVFAAIWLTPCYLAYRARQQNEEDSE